MRDLTSSTVALIIGVVLLLSFTFRIEGANNAPRPTQAPPAKCFCDVTGSCECSVCRCDPPAVARGCRAVPVKHRGEWWCQAAGSWWIHRSGRWVRFEQPAIQIYQPMVQAYQVYQPAFGSSFGSSGFGGACSGGG